MRNTLLTLRSRAAGWLEGPRMPAYAALTALLVGLPTLGIGLVLDDHFLQVSMLRDPAYDFVTKPPLDVFRIFDGDPVRTLRMIDRGAAVWWSDPHIRIAFLRPLTAATHLLDFTIAPNAAWWMHLHSLFYYVLAVWMAAVVYRKVLGPGAVAGLAALLFAVDGCHGLAVGWVANRNQLVAAFFALASFATFIRCGTRGAPSAGNLLLGPVLLALGFGGGEAALAILAYFAAYALVLDRRPPKAQLSALAPYLVVTVAWALFYRAGGYGTSCTGFYHDPIRAPMAYAMAAAQHLPLLAMNELAGLPADLFVMLASHGRIAVVALALALALMVAAILSPTLRRDREARFLGLAGLLGLLPVCATAPSARLLLIPSVGLLGLMARFVVTTRAEGRAAPRRARAYAGYFLTLHIALAIPWFQAMARQLTLLERVVERLAAGLDADPALPGTRVLVVNAPDGHIMLFLGLLRHVTGHPMPYAITPLALGTRGLTLARTSAKTLRLRPDGGFVVGATERLTSDAKSPWTVGARVQLTGLTIEVVALTPDRRPQTVDLVFERALEDTSLRFKEWNGDTLVPFQLPRIGAWRRMEARELRVDALPSESRSPTRLGRAVDDTVPSRLRSNSVARRSARGRSAGVGRIEPQAVLSTVESGPAQPRASCGRHRGAQDLADAGHLFPARAGVSG